MDADYPRKWVIIACRFTYQSRQRQAQALSGLLDSLTEHEQTLRQAAEKMKAPDFDSTLFNPEHPGDHEVLRWADGVTATVGNLAAQVLGLADFANEQQKVNRAALEAMEWRTHQQETKAAYDGLVATLKEQGVKDPSQYADLVEQRQELEDRLREMTDLRASLDATLKEAKESFSRLVALRESLTQQRSDFLREALGGNQHVRIKVLQFRESKADIEAQFRAIIGRTDTAFASDILSDNGQQGLIANLYEALPTEPAEAAAELTKRLGELKRDLLEAARRPENSRFGAWFTKHLQQLKPEAFDRIWTWFPEDALSVEYSPRGDGRDFRPLEQGSPGQKTAAILAFILAHGNEPIVLDQPEDDLDNQLIYDLIVSQIRENKLRRQVIVVTHNPNIVVNGDAEAVFAMGYHSGQCKIIAEGCLQSTKVRDTVCEIMEGGKEAFQKRYQRIIGSV